MKCGVACEDGLVIGFCPMLRAALYSSSVAGFLKRLYL